MISADAFGKIHPLAGKPAPAEILINVSKLEQAYFHHPFDSGDPLHMVSFGTSGHRGSPSNGTFNEHHILAVAQAVCDYRRAQGINGPLFVGKDTHAASLWAERTVLEVLAANGVEAFYQQNDKFTPTPAISRCILAYNRGRKIGLSDGLVITPSHNPPADGGIKYNPTNGGPAETDITKAIQDRANELLRAGNAGVKRVGYASAMRSANLHAHDFMPDYVADLASVIDLEAIAAAGVKIGVDPMGGASVDYWLPIRERYGLNLELANSTVDPTFRFMTVDHDGKIRMDCSSSYAMAGLVGLRKKYDIAFGNDADADRHGIVTPDGGLMDANHYLAAAIRYLLRSRTNWPAGAAVGKTLVSSSMIDAVIKASGRKLYEVPVGFKWFADGLFKSNLCFGGEESAGASFLRRDGTVWTTDKDGLILDLLAAEMLAKTGKNPHGQYQEIVADFGPRFYNRVDVPASRPARDRLKAIKPEEVAAPELAGDAVVSKLSKSPGTNFPIGGIKVVTRKGWFAVRPSGTEDKAKIYAESTSSKEHLQQLFNAGCQIVSRVTA
jgi:phosphoglucomutase